VVAKENPRLTKPRDEVRDRLKEQRERGEALRQAAHHPESRVAEAKLSEERWTKFVGALLRALFTSDALVQEIEGRGPFNISSDDGRQWEALDERMNNKLSALDSILERVEIYDEALPGVGDNVAAVDPPTTDVFVVHGHDDATRDAAARFLTKAGLTPVILHEQASGGRTVIEKLEHYANVGFALVLLTPDDVGGPKDGPAQPRARQNVIAELFYFIGRLGRDRVCALKKGEIEIPSDIGGVVYVELDDRGAWKHEVLRELEAAGYAVDWKKALN
jgi:predicted nucleotide-binding protein